MRLDAFDREVLTLAADLLADAELGPDQRRRVRGVVAQHSGLGEQDLDAASLDAQDGAESELGFGIGDPALTGGEMHQQAVPDGGGADYPVHPPCWKPAVGA